MNKIKNLGIINLICVILCLIAQVVVLFGPDANIWAKITTILTIVGLIFGIVYGFKGYKKSAAAFYKLFMLFYALTELATLITLVTGDTPTNFGTIFFTIFSVHNIVSITILTVGKDLGRTNSFILAGIPFAVYFIGPIIGLILALSGNSAISSVEIIRECGKLMLASTAWLFVYEKYTDKAARGRD